MSSTAVPLDQLIGLFYADSEPLGSFQQVWCNASQPASPGGEHSALFDIDVPDPYRQLLAHQNHMTITLESFHGSSVSVEVLETRQQRDRYCRKILLRRTSDHRVVQFGIVRLDLSRLAAQPRTEIVSQKTPLGRVLIEHNVMRSVELACVWRLTCGSELRRYFGCETGTSTYGRTALIYFEDQPALELLEIMAPAGSFEADRRS